MQKLIQRTAQAEKQVARRLKKASRISAIGDRTQRFVDQRKKLTELNEDIRAARLARHEKWVLGPLAPRHDVLDSYGASKSGRQGHTLSLKPEEVEARFAWAGGSQYPNIAVNDRVVVLEGPDKGKIDRIESIEVESGTVTLKNISKITTAIPETFQESFDTTTQNVAMKIPVSAIRLVHPILDPVTGAARDVIIRQLARGPVKWSRHTGWRAWTRYIPGANIAIPWPERENPVREDHPADTKRTEVEEATFVPTLLSPPMPESLIDELRNKYSRFRTRHEDEYILRKEAEEAEKKAAKNISAHDFASMRTPLQEFNRQQREERRAYNKPELTTDMLQRIGEIIAKNKAAASGTSVSTLELSGPFVAAAEASEESPSPPR